MAIVGILASLLRAATQAWTAIANVHRQHRRDLTITANTQPEPWQGGPVTTINAIVHAAHGFHHPRGLRIVALSERQTLGASQRRVVRPGDTGYEIPLTPPQPRDQTIRLSLRNRYGRELADTLLRL
jgi:hypothetical protein